MPDAARPIGLRWLSPVDELSAVAGLGWALIAFFIGYRAFGYTIAGGIIMAPFIGILIGRLSSSLQDTPRWAQIAGSLFYLYVAAVCFAVGMALAYPVLGPGDMRFPSALIGLVMAVLWGLTFSGYVLLLWPLSFFTHRLVWQADAGQVATPPELRITSTAIRTLATRIMILSVLAYAAWALFHVVLAIGGTSQSPMPWWVVTDLMRWSSWSVLGVLVWLLAPALALGATAAAGSEERSTSTYRELVGVLGFVVCVFPVLSFAAGLAVTAIKVWLVQSWATEGTVFWNPQYYRNVVHGNLPWFLVGAAMIAVRWLIGFGRTSSTSENWKGRG